MSRISGAKSSVLRHWPANGSLLLLLSLCASLPRAAHAQTSDLGGAATGDSGSNVSGGSLLQQGPSQPGGLGSTSDLSTTAGTSMRDRIDSALGLQAPSNANRPALLFTPAISLAQGWTSNAALVPGTNSAAFTTQIAPSIGISADSRRLQGSFTYAPNFIIYEPNRNENNIAQNLSLHAHAIVIPDLFFIDVSGFAAQQTIGAGFGPSGAPVANQSYTSQDYAFSISPYVMRRIGDFGTVEVGGAVGETAQLVPADTFAAPLPGQPTTAVQSFHATPTSEHIAFSSGNSFGRWLSNAYLLGSQGNGTGVMSGAYRYEAIDEAGYAITRRMTVLAAIGWDDVYYGGYPSIRVNSALWNFGVRLTPNPDSQITVLYGRKDGIDAPFVAAAYQLSPRTRITANYSVTLSSDLEQLSNALTTSTTDSYGNPINANNGQPLLAGNNFSGMLSSVYKLTAGSIVATLLLDRDTFQAGFMHQQQLSLNVAEPSLIAYNTTGNYGTLSWQHDLSQAIKARASAQFGTLDSETGGITQNSTVVLGSAMVSYEISDKLTATLQYTYSRSDYQGPLPGYNVNLVLVGLHKTF